MTLTKTKSKRVGYENYFDFNLVWQRDNKIYSVRIKPVFSRDNKLLHACAVNVPEGEILEKYL